MKTALTLSAAVLLAACMTDGPSRPRTRELTLAGKLPASCPIGVVCDENFEYHAYSGGIDSFSIYVSFKPAILKGKSNENVLSAFSYLYFQLSFPSRATDSSISYVFSPALSGIANDSLEYKSEILRFEKGRLYGRLRFPVFALTERIASRSEDCVAGDIRGICYRTRYLHEPVEYTVNYELELID